MSDVIKDASASHWVYKMPKSWQPYLQLSRLDRPIGYWLLALPGWIGIAFAGLMSGYDKGDLWLAAIILIGAVAMRGAGCTYNDIVDQDLDAKVERTARRPLPSGQVSTPQAWVWLVAQCLIGLVVLLLLPNQTSQIIALCSLPLVAAYPFMKRITWWPQLWLGLVFTWAVLVAFAAKLGRLDISVLYLYAGLIFWCIGYDTIYACQDIEDDAIIGVKSTARRFGKHVKLGVGICYALFLGLTFIAVRSVPTYETIRKICQKAGIRCSCDHITLSPIEVPIILIGLLPVTLHLLWNLISLEPKSSNRCLSAFKAHRWTATWLILGLLFIFVVMGISDSGSIPQGDVIRFERMRPRNCDSIIS